MRKPTPPGKESRSRGSDLSGLAATAQTLESLVSFGGLLICALMGYLGENILLRLAIFSIWLASALGSFALRRAGNTKGAVVVISAGGFAITCIYPWLSGGASSIYVSAYPVVILGAGILRGARVAWGTAALCVINIAAMATASYYGVLPHETFLHTPVSDTALITLFCLISLACVRIAITRVSKSVELAKSRAEDASAHALAYSELFNASSAAMAVTTKNAFVAAHSSALAINPAFEKLTGRNAADIFDTGALFELWASKELRNQCFKRVASEGRLPPVNADLLRSDGAPIPCIVRAEPIDWMGKKALLWTLLDLSSEALVRKTLEAAHIDLSAHIQSKALDLANAEHAISRRQRLASMGEVVAGVAHEINTPIGNALLAASTLEEPLRKLREMSTGKTLSRSSLSRSASKVLEASRLTLDNLSRAVDVIGNFKQLSHDTVGSARAHFILGTVLEDAIGASAPALSRRRARWSLFVEPRLQTALFDSHPGAISQIITIWASNAIAHAFDWPEAPSNWQPELSIQASLFQGPGGHPWARAELCDNGRGISPDIAAKLFDPYFTTKPNAGGTGLGLTLARDFARSTLGGEFALAPTPSGARFVLEFPCLAPDNESQEAE